MNAKVKPCCTSDTEYGLKQNTQTIRDSKPRHWVTVSWSTLNCYMTRLIYFHHIEYQYIDMRKFNAVGNFRVSYLIPHILHPNLWLRTSLFHAIASRIGMFTWTVSVSISTSARYWSCRVVKEIGNILHQKFVPYSPLFGWLYRRDIASGTIPSES